MALASSHFLEVGSTGLKHWGGAIEDEFLRELRGARGVTVYREMSRNDAVVGASLFAYTTLAKEVTFRVDSAKQGDAKADEVADFVSSALFDDMSASWRDLLSEIMTFLIYGWSWFEIVYKRREGPMQSDPSRRSRFSDNRIGWRKWAMRGQDTLDTWHMDDAGGIQGMIQRAAPVFTRIEIPITKSLLFRTTAERGNPEGASILRTAYQSYYYKRRLQVIRGIGIERDLAGLPVLTPPEGVDIWNPNDSVAVATKASAESIVRNIRRDEHEGVLKPFGWTLELLTAGGGRQFDITEVIAQLNAEIAMSMMTDFLLVGHEKIGARSLSEDKRDVFSHANASFLDNICDVVNRFAIPALCRLNGWDEELFPKLAHGPVAEIDLASLVTFIEKTSGAGLLFPDEDLEKYLRTRAQLPPPPDRAPAAKPTTLAAATVDDTTDDAADDAVAKYAPGQPRDKSGRFGSGGSAVGARATAETPVATEGLGTVVAALQEPGGGFTYHAATGTAPKTGYAVAVYRGREKTFDVKDMTANDLANYAVDNWDVLKQKDTYFGGWHNPSDGKVYLDISRVVPTRAAALSLGLKHDQLAVFDLSQGVTIPVTGRGSRGGKA